MEQAPPVGKDEGAPTFANSNPVQENQKGPYQDHPTGRRSQGEARGTATPQEGPDRDNNKTATPRLGTDCALTVPKPPDNDSPNDLVQEKQQLLFQVDSNQDEDRWTPLETEAEPRPE